MGECVLVVALRVGGVAGELVETGEASAGRIVETGTQVIAAILVVEPFGIKGDGGNLQQNWRNYPRPLCSPEILGFAERFVETRFEELRRREFNAYEVGPYLVEIAMTLQRFGDTRSNGLNLFESLLRAGLDEANKALQDVDAVNEVDQQNPRRPSRGRRNRKQ